MVMDTAIEFRKALITEDTAMNISLSSTIDSNLQRCPHLSTRDILNLTDEIVDGTSELTHGFSKVIITLWITIAIAGFILNLAQIIWILIQKRKSVIDVFIVSLAVVDLQTCCFNIPIEVVEMVNEHNWEVFGNHAEVMCHFHWYFRYGSVVTGSIIICLIAVSRYIAISHPIRKAREKCSQMCVNVALAVLTWVITIALVAPIVFSTTSVTRTFVITDYGQTDHVSNSSCYKTILGCHPQDSGVGIVIYGSVLFFVAPSLVLSISYASLIRILVKRKHNKMLAYEGNKKHFRKSIVNSILGLSYIILITPKGVYDIIQLPRASTQTQPSTRESDIETILYVVATFVVITNPVIYSFLTPRFFKYVEDHAHHRHDYSDELEILNDIDWSRKPRGNFLTKFLSHDKLHDDSYHHIFHLSHHRKHHHHRNTTVHHHKHQNRHNHHHSYYHRKHRYLETPDHSLNHDQDDYRALTPIGEKSPSFHRNTRQSTVETIVLPLEDTSRDNSNIPSITEPLLELDDSVEGRSHYEISVQRMKSTEPHGESAFNRNSKLYATL